METALLAHDSCNLIKPRFFDDADLAEGYINEQVAQWMEDHPSSDTTIPFEGFTKIIEEMSLADALNYIMEHR